MTRARLRAIGVELDDAPALLDARSPLALGVVEQGDGSYVALAGVELTTFQVLDGKGTQEAQVATVGLNEAITLLAGPRSIALVVAPRANGSSLRAGWVAIGRGAQVIDAQLEVEATTRAIAGLAAIALDGVADVACVTEADALFDLVRPLFAGAAVELRRTPFVSHGARIASLAGEPPAASSSRAWLPWLLTAGSWSSLLSALLTSGDAAVVVRLDVGVSPTAELLERVGRETSRALRADMSRKIAEVLGERVAALRAASVAARFVLTGSEGIPLAAVAAAKALLVPARIADHALPRVQADELVEPRLMAPVTFDPDWDRLLTPAEALVLARLPDPPTDDLSALPTTRARVHPLSGATVKGTSVGLARRASDRVEAALAEETRFRHCYVVGQTGTGKSTLLLRMITQDIAAGHGVTVLDPHGTLVDAVLEHVPKERADDVVYVDPTDTRRVFPLDPLSVRAQEGDEYLTERDLVISELFDTFDRLYDLKSTGGPIFEQVFRTYMALLLGTSLREEPPRLPMLELLLRDNRRARKLARELSGDPITPATLHMLMGTQGDASLSHLGPYITSKLARFYASASSRRMLTAGSAHDFDESVAKRHIILVKLPSAALGIEAAALIARQIVLRVSQACIRRGASADSPAHFLYADEFHHFASERFATLLSEARKYRLGLVLAHQYTGQLLTPGPGRGTSILDAVLGNVGTLIAFRVGAADAALLSQSFEPRAVQSDVAGLRNHTALVRVFGQFGDAPFSLWTRPVPPGHAELGAMIRELARYKHMRKSALVDAELESALEGFGGRGGDDE